MVVEHPGAEGVFDVSLANTFTRVTLRGLSHATKGEGRIHVDDESKKAGEGGGDACNYVQCVRVD